MGTGDSMAKDREQIMKELEELREEVKGMGADATSKGSQNADAGDAVSSLMKAMIEERERTNRRLEELNQRITRLREAVASAYEEEPQAYTPADREVALSELDLLVLNFVQSSGMVNADNLKEYMHYSGRNAACARLNKLYLMGLVERHQLGHKVYYKFDAGKTTKTLIISPPQ